MRTLGLVVVLSGCVSPLPTEERVQEVVNGTPAGDPEGVGALFFEGTFEGQPVARVACSGTLIAPDIVLTAAHCVDPYIVDMVGLPRFSTAADTTLQSATFVSVTRAILHPGYASQTVFHIFLETPNDVALLVLSEPVAATPISIIADPVALDEQLIAAGYGQQVIGDDGTVGIEHTAPVGVTELGATELRTLGIGDPLPCAAQGDSGGAALADRGGVLQLAGVMSHFGGETEACESGGVYQRAEVYGEWIASEAPATCETSALAGCPTDDGGCSSSQPHGGGLVLAIAALGWRRRRFRSR